MISHRYRCIFIHQRKNAGSSVITSFGLDPKDPDWHAYNDGFLSPGWEKRGNAIRDYLVFTVIRNPWDRFVSGWKYLDATRNRPLLDVLREFPGNYNPHDYRHLCRPQSDTLVDRSGRLIADFVLRYEHLARDYELLCERIGKTDRKLPHLNSTKHRNYRTLYDDEARELLGRHFSKDIELLGYDFSGEQNPPPELKEKIPQHT